MRGQWALMLALPYVCRYLAEGILPTTNEISVLKSLEDGEEEVVQNQDGFFIGGFLLLFFER